MYENHTIGTIMREKETKISLWRLTLTLNRISCVRCDYMRMIMRLGLFSEFSCFGCFGHSIRIFNEGYLVFNDEAMD
jgi:hypothetical protein